MDYDVLNDIGCLEGKELIVYGAGQYGSRASKMLLELGFPGHRFCDRDAGRHGTDFLGRKILPLWEVEKMDNLLLITAIGDKETRRTVEQTLSGIPGARLLSFFALEKAWKYTTIDPAGTEAVADAFQHWYGNLSHWTGMVKEACSSPVLVYQYGKVGSSTVQQSLKKAGILSTQIHHFFARNQVSVRMMDDVGYQCGTLCFDSPEYEERIRREMRGRKIITMVRDPIAVDLSRVFQDLGSGVGDRYFMDQMGRGDGFHQTVVKRMMRTQNRIFDWFDAELKKLCGIDVFAHPFDCEKGYAVIRENGVEVLLLKTEKLSGLAEVIGDFVGLPHFKLADTNVGEEKEYAHLYRKTKENLVLPKEYVDMYYEGNQRMNHFYSEAEREALKRKWRRD